jgi:hypothetical protein
MTTGDAEYDAFEILGVIGEGAFGLVHYARHRSGTPVTACTTRGTRGVHD